MTDLSRRLQGFVGRHGASVASVMIGSGMIIAALTVPKGGDPLATPIATLGTGLVVLGVVLPRLAEGEITPTGVKVKLDPEATLRFAENPDQAAAAVRKLGAGTDDLVAATRYLLASEMATYLLHPRSGSILADCELHLYLWDEVEQRLLPTFEADPAQVECWESGRGAVGRAWDTEKYVLMEGKEVTDSAAGLADAQRARYASLAAVAAMPVVNAVGDIIGVLSASSDRTDSALKSAAGREEHLTVAAKVARLLIDVLKWFQDRYDDSTEEGAT